jgi:hypothetical protein
VKFLFDDANASANIIPSLEQFSQKQFHSDSISGMIPTMQLINQVNQFIRIYKFTLTKLFFFKGIK